MLLQALCGGNMKINTMKTFLAEMRVYRYNLNTGGIYQLYKLCGGNLNWTIHYIGNHNKGVAKKKSVWVCFQMLFLLLQIPI